MLVIKKLKDILPNMRVSKSLLIIMVGLLFFARGNIMARPDPLKFNRGQIADLTFDEDAKSVYQYALGIAIANDDIPNMSIIDKFGQNDNIDQNQDNDIWDLGGIYSFLSEPTVLTLSSVTSTDEVSDTGARTIRIFTLDDTWALASQSVTMKGLSGITLTGLHRRVYRKFVETAGSNNGAEATIHTGFGSITAGVPDTSLAAILPDNNQTLMAIMTVPSGFSGYIKEWYGGFHGITGTARFGDLHLISRTNSGVRRLRRAIGLSTSVTPYIESHYCPIKFEEKTDVIMMANNVSSDNLSISAGFDLIMIRN